MSEKPVFSIIIVSWNVGSMLEMCLRSILEFAAPSIEVIVIDNASQDNTKNILDNISVQYRQKGVPFITFIHNNNLGFAYAVNRGIERSTGNYIILLNPDTKIIEYSFSIIKNFFETHPKCGIVGCRLINGDGTTQTSVRRFPSVVSQFFILLKLHHLFPNLKPLKKYFMRDFDATDVSSVDQVMGAFFVFSKSLIEDIGYFDENFFLWFEEVDFCKRAIDAGYHVYYTPDTKIIHYGGQSFQKLLSFQKQKIYNNSLLYYYKKHASILGCCVVFGLYIPSMVFAGLYSLWNIANKYRK